MTLSALALTACVFLYLFGAFSVSVLAAVLWLACAVCFLMRKHLDLSLQVPLILLIATLLCVYIGAYNHYIIKPIEKLDGKSGNITARVIEEPEFHGEYAILTVKTLKHDSDFKGIKLKLILNTNNSAADAEVGDILTSSVKLAQVSKQNKSQYYSCGIYISAFCDNTEITGHKYTLYETCVDIRQSVRAVIRNNYTGDTGGLINGVLLGDNSGMSDELLAAFKTCGVSHVTAVSGLHISIICSAFITVISMFVKRRKAAIISILPLIAAVSITGFTPSAVRSGIMSLITFSGIFSLKRTDSLNSLGVAITAMLIYNPLYVLDIGFQLSCSATTGVIIAAKIATPIIQRKIIIKNRIICNIVKSTFSVFAQSLGASIFTLPFQMLIFGSVSVISPLANIAIFIAVTYLLLSALIAVILSYIPFICVISKPVFFIAGLFSDYIAAIVTLLAKVPFSAIPIGNDATILWIGLSLALIGIWLLFERVGGMRFIAILITALLLISLWSQKLASRGVIEVSALDAGDGFCTVIARDSECILIGCGDDLADANIISNHLRRTGINKIVSVVIPSNDSRYLGGLNTINKRFEIDKIILTESSSKDSLAVIDETNQNCITLLENTLTQTDVEDVILSCYNLDGGSVIKAVIFEKTFIIGLCSPTLSTVERIDCTITGMVLPKNIYAPIMIISGDHYIESPNTNNTLFVSTNQKNIIIKLARGKEPTVYAKE